jgi:hypothetical protein
MKYIKLYESFETDLQDILLEVTDMGYEFKINPGLNFSTIIIENNKKSDFNIILDCALRLKDYLGDRYNSCYLFKDATQQANAGWHTFDLKEGCDLNNAMSLQIFFKK